MGIRRIKLFNQALLGKWLWCFRNEVTHLWHQVIATKYGEARGGWCTRVVRRTHGYGMWKNIRKGVESFFAHVVYAMREGIRIQFWYDPQSSPFSLKDLYLDLFACAMVQEAQIFYLILIALDGGGRSWILLFCRTFQDWELERVNTFLSTFTHKYQGGRVMIF